MKQSAVLKHASLHILIVSSLFMFCALPVFSIDLSTPDWEIVADGASISRPVQMRQGYVTVTDGRTLIGWTERGEKLFQRKLNRKPSDLLCVDNADFIFSVSYDRKYLSLFNQDGLLLWEKHFTIGTINACPLPGRDGRVFVPLQHEIVCLNTYGSELWRLPFQDISILTLYEKSDGSILVNDRYAVSPFGDLLSTEESASEGQKSSVSETVWTATCILRTSTGKKNSSVTAYDFDGTELWSKSFQPENVLFYEVTDSTIMTLSESWVIAGYRYNSSPVSIAQAKLPLTRLYESRYGRSAQETDYHLTLTKLNAVVKSNNSMSINPAVRTVIYDVQYLRKAADTGCDFSSVFSDVILSETDSGVLETAVSCAAKLGRDPDGLIFNAIETRLNRRTSFQFDDSMYVAFCDALYEICRKSGTNQRLLKALELISPLASTDYRTLVQRHAINTIEKLLELQKVRLQK